MEPPEGVSVVNVMTPSSAASSPTAGPPELPCAAAASVCTMSWPMESCLKPETAPLVTDASSVAVAQANGRIHVVLHAHQREVTAGIGRGLAVEVEGERRTELDDVRLEADAARQQHRQQRLRRHLR